MRRRGAEAGQATVELVAILPLVAVVAALLWQIVVAGQAVSFAGAAARAAARAAAVGGDPARAARAVVPPRLQDGLRVRRAKDGSVRVAVRVPAVMGGGAAGTVRSSARFAPQGGG